ncbi:double-headed protease inhibitor, submandibular gland-like [Microcebus murinus]|uniref:double-headed protease inhibitor, submandibular gland-like n=1 Tax=Microcebus murinus TaxID=30608 RepID=UPI000642E23F|nr:double-headed protease inhibitor, submandibular gland-like [Microcebus murinus]
MKGIAALAIFALAATAWAASPAAKGTEVDCSQYNGKGTKIACPRNLSPICGTDQKTYSNECMLCMQNQEKNLQLRKLHDGNCIKCTKYSEVCTMEYIPHCGSDGKEYPNQCTFCNAVVESRGTLSLENYGKCSPMLKGTKSPSGRFR